MAWIAVESFAYEIDANVAKSKLEAHGIQCYTRPNRMGDALLGSFGLSTGPRDLVVQEKDVKQAKDLLQ